MLKQFSSRPLRLVSRRAALGMLGAAALVRSGPPASAQDVEPIRIVIAFPPGGTSTASLQPLRAPLGTRHSGRRSNSIIVPALGGNVAALHVIQAKPDGRTLLFGHAGPLAINHHILVQTVFDAQRDLIPARHGGPISIVICAAAKLNVIDPHQGLIDLARREPADRGLLRQRFDPAPRSSRLSAETTGSQESCIFHSPVAVRCRRHSSAAPFSVLLETGSNIVKYVQAGTLRPLAVMARERLSTLPAVPTPLGQHIGAKIALAQPECV